MNKETTDKPEERCGEISLEGYRVCGLSVNHIGPHAFIASQNKGEAACGAAKSNGGLN